MQGFQFDMILSMLFAASLISSGLALLAWILEKSPTAWRPERLIYCLWILVLLRLIWMIAPASQLSVLNLWVTGRESVAFGMSPTESSRLLNIEPAREMASTSTSVNQLPVSGPNLIPRITGMVLLSIWALGLAVLIRQLIRRFLEVRGIVTRAKVNPISQTLQEIVKTTCTKNVRQRVGLAVTTDLAVPAVVGIFRPIILIPQWCEQELTPEQLELIVIHERVHVGRKDLLIQFLAHLIRIVHWFNPLAYLATAKLAHWQEINCDRQVLRDLQGDRKRSKLYGQTLLEIFTRASSEPLFSNRVSNLAPGFIGAINVRRNRNVCNLIERIQMLQQPTLASLKSSIFTGVLLTLLIAVSFTSAQEIPTLAVEGQESVEAKEEDLLPVAIKVTMYIGTTQKVSSLMDTIASGQLQDKVFGPPPIGYVNPENWIPLENAHNFSRRVDLGLPESDLQKKFQTLTEDLKIISDINLNTRYELAAKLSIGAKVPRFDKDGKPEFLPVGHELTITPLLRKGKKILDLTWSHRRVGRVTIVRLLPDGTKTLEPQVLANEIQTRLVVPEGSVVQEFNIGQEDSFLIKIECTDLEPVRAVIQTESNPADR